MWLATTRGFFSIVKNRFDDSGNTWFIRARRRQDLENLVEAAGIEVEIHTSQNADYRYRLVVDEGAVRAVRDALFDNLTYPNFKDAVAEVTDQADKLHAYHDVWSTQRSSRRRCFTTRPR